MAKKKPDDAAAEAERRFKADLKAGTLGSFYIICGEEAFLLSLIHISEPTRPY